MSIRSDRTGQGADPAFTLVGRRRHRGQELRQDAPGTDVHQRRVGRAGNHLCRSDRIERDKVQILLSPLSGDEGIAVKNFAKTHPELTFINAASGAQETTYVDPAPNFFRFNMDGAQW